MQQFYFVKGKVVFCITFATPCILDDIKRYLGPDFTSFLSLLHFTISCFCHGNRFHSGPIWLPKLYVHIHTLIYPDSKIVETLRNNSIVNWRNVAKIALRWFIMMQFCTGSRNLTSSYARMFVRAKNVQVSKRLKILYKDVSILEYY